VVASGRNVNGRNVKAPFYPILRIFGWSIQRHDLSKMLELENEHKSKDEPKKKLKFYEMSAALRCCMV
jgi:hypothetical protein